MMTRLGWRIATRSAKLEHGSFHSALSSIGVLQSTRRVAPAIRCLAFVSQRRNEYSLFSDAGAIRRAAPSKLEQTHRACLARRDARRLIADRPRARRRILIFLPENADMKFLIPAVALLLAAPVIAMPPQGDPSKMFLKTFDANNDGRVSKDEFVKPQIQQIEKQFDYMDKNKDGVVDKQEAEAFAQEMQKKMQQMRKQYDSGRMER
jgi:hypothetical protein